ERSSGSGARMRPPATPARSSAGCARFPPDAPLPAAGRCPRRASLPSRMEVRQLRCFQAVAEELSFSRAARRLRVAQPAVSRTIRELEDQLGVSLLNRTRRSVSLTPAGAVL